MIEGRLLVKFALNAFSLLTHFDSSLLFLLTLKLRRFRIQQSNFLGRISHHSSESRLSAKNEMGEELGLSLQLTCSFQPHLPKTKSRSRSYHQFSHSSHQPSNLSSVSFISSFICFARVSTATSGSEVHSPIAIRS